MSAPAVLPALFIFTVIFFGGVSACDVCGVFVGVRPNQVGHRAEILFRSRAYGGYVRLPTGQADQQRPIFKTAHDPALHGSPETVRYDASDYSRHLSAELRSSVFLTKRTQLLTVLPYVWNSVRIAGSEDSYSGIGDPTLLASYALVQRDSTPTAAQWLIQGGGQLPLGRFARDAAQSHLLPGAGAPVALIGTSLGLRRGGWGLWTMALARMAPENRTGFRTANLYTATLTVFRDFQWTRGEKRSHFMPHAGTHYENHNGEFKRGAYQYGTGGQLLFGLLGFELALGRWGLLAQAQQPLVQDLLGTQLGAGGRFNLGLSYTFAGRTLFR